MVEEIVTAQQKLDFFNPFFLTLYGLAAIFFLSIFFLIKSKIGWKKSSNIIGISLGITFILEVLFWVIGSNIGMFLVMCGSFKDCPSQFDTFLFYLPYTGIFVFMITLFIFSLIMFIRRKVVKVDF